MWLSLWFACTRPVPPHLAVPVATPDPTPEGVRSLDEAYRVMLRNDPLARRPRLLPAPMLDRVDPSGELARFSNTIREVEAGRVAPARALGQQAWKDGPHALARGYLWGLAENRLAGMAGSTDLPPLVELITPLLASDEDGDPLGFLDTEEAIRRYGERQVLEGWLHPAQKPPAPVAEALNEERHARLAALPAGRLILARLGPSPTDARDSDGFALLERATLLALTRASADRAHEHAAWADLLLAAREELQTDDPIGLLLDRSFDALLPFAARDEEAGAALVVIGARRWRGRCPDPPCDGLDRTALLAAARRYGGRAASLAAVWQVIALKDALDGMDAGHDTVAFPRAVRRLVDALHGTGAGPLRDTLLLTPRPNPGTWADLAEAVGGETATDWPSARAALERHAKAVVSDALTIADSPETIAILRRISERMNR